MTHVNLDAQPEAVRQFVLALSVPPDGVVLESAGQPVACVVPPPKSLTRPGTQEGEQNDSRSAVADYPAADFLEPIRYDWTEAGYEVHQALKSYSEETHADY
jgi:hypothetical protein